MRDLELPAPLKLDPWAASSLLQKAIRRGEAGLASRAGLTLYRQRGPAVFKRLCMIAVEDIGLADISLIQDVVRIGTDKSLRSVLGSDAELIDDLCSRMASAPKDRSADYLICAATKLETALADRAELKNEPVSKLIGIATDENAILVRRAVAALLACGSAGDDQPVQPAHVAHLLDAFPVKPLPLHDAVLRLIQVRAHPFCLMLPLIWSRWWHSGAGSDVVEDELPPAEFVGDVPLYAYDFHTAAGKQAIARFACENDAVAATLRACVPERNWISVAEIAAFYADAAPVARRLEWSGGNLLPSMGLNADMVGAGCPIAGITPILESVRSNLDHLNAMRRLALGRRFASWKRASRFVGEAGDIQWNDDRDDPSRPTGET